MEPYVYAVAGFGALVLLTAWLPMVLRALPLSLPICCVGAGAALSFVPDVALETLRFIPGTTSTGVLALSLMHVVVLGVVIPLSAILSARGRSADR